MQKPNLTKVFNGVKIATVKHSPEILMGIGITGMVTTTVMAVRATPKALMLIEVEKRRLNRELLEEAKKSGCEECNQITHLEPVDLIKATWKCYIPAGITGIVSIACLIGASSVNARRNAALATAYTLSETTLRDYQKKVIETIGEKKEQTVRDAVAKEHIERDPVENKEVIFSGRGNTLCYDSISGRYFRSDMDAIKKAENELDARLRNEMYISLNEFYYEIGLEPLSVIGDDLGWNIDSGYLDLGFSSQIATDGTPCLVIEYNPAPRYDYRNLM
jgi:hypothetical protein